MQERTPCEICGKPVTPGRMQKHARSVRHRNADLVRTMLRDPFTAFSDVAKKLKVSREMVRVIALEMGLGTGRERIREKWEEEAKAPLKVLPVYGDPDLDMSPVFAKPRNKTLHKSTPRKAEINGYLCAIRQAQPSPAVLENNDEAWVRIGTVALKRPVQFVLYELPKDCVEKGWLVVPIQKVPRRASDINLREAPIPPSQDFTGPWRAYLNAWHLLKA